MVNGIGLDKHTHSTRVMCPLYGLCHARTIHGTIVKDVRGILIFLFHVG